MPVTGREGPQGCETSRLPYFLDNRLTDCGEVCQPYAPATIYHQEDSWCSLSRPQDRSAAGMIRLI
jgi:hypothetical protein